MNRRAFLGALAAAALAPVASAAFVPLDTNRRRMVIVGLSCAYELQKRGLDVVVLEGQVVFSQKPGCHFPLGWEKNRPGTVTLNRFNHDWIEFEEIARW